MRTTPHRLAHGLVVPVLRSSEPAIITRLVAIVLLSLTGACGCSNQETSVNMTPAQPKGKLAAAPNLTHEETLAWIDARRAWRRVRKTEPIWARAVTLDEIGKKVQTADRAIEEAREGAWLCIGIANEPWFQSLEKIEKKYNRAHAESRQFPLDHKPYVYVLFEPKPEVLNWAARVDDPSVAGFWIRPAYDPDTPLYSVSGGYVLKGDVTDPYREESNDVWLVQKDLFNKTYEILPNE